MIYKDYLQDWTEGCAPVPTYVIEVTAMLERALNYMHTGNPKVIHSTTMNPLFIGLSIVDCGTPYFSTVIKMGTDLVYTPEQWPESVPGVPASAARRSAFVTYDRALENVSSYFSVTGPHWITII